MLDAALSGGVVRAGLAGIEGLDLPALATRLPWDPAITTELGAAFEAGLLRGASEKAKREREKRG